MMKVISPLFPPLAYLRPMTHGYLLKFSLNKFNKSKNGRF